MRTPERPPADIVIRAPLVRADLAGLCARIRRRIDAERPAVAYCDVAGFDQVDAVVVDALARLQLLGRRRGCEMRLCHASPELRQLVELMGLDGVLVCVP